LGSLNETKEKSELQKSIVELEENINLLKSTIQKIKLIWRVLRKKSKKSATICVKNSKKQKKNSPKRRKTCEQEQLEQTFDVKRAQKVIPNSENSYFIKIHFRKFPKNPSRHAKNSRRIY